MYFKLFKGLSWGKRSAIRRRRLIQSFPYYIIWLYMANISLRGRREIRFLFNFR